MTRLLVGGECTGMDGSGRGAPLSGTETCAGNVWSTKTTRKTHTTTAQQTCAVVKGFKQLGDYLIQGKMGKSIINVFQWWMGFNCGEQMVQSINTFNSYHQLPPLPNKKKSALSVSSNVPFEKTDKSDLP